jgi:hypothetical protein
VADPVAPDAVAVTGTLPVTGGRVGIPLVIGLVLMLAGIAVLRVRAATSSNR